MNLFRASIILIAVTANLGCDKLSQTPTIDTSSKESMKQSVQKVRESLSEDERTEFELAVQSLAFSQIKLVDVPDEGMDKTRGLERRMMDLLHGKTAHEVMFQVDLINIERKTREKEQALIEIKGLELVKSNAKASKEQLSLFEVIESRFSMYKSKYMGEKPNIELTVKNGTGTPISRAYFEGTISSPGRSVPWFKNTFNYSIPGGLEPGEEASWSLTPGMFSGWGNVAAPVDAIFTVTVEQLDDAEGEVLYSASGLSDYEQNRLSELKKKYNVDSTN